MKKLNALMPGLKSLRNQFTSRKNQNDKFELFFCIYTAISPIIRGSQIRQTELNLYRS